MKRLILAILFLGNMYAMGMKADNSEPVTTTEVTLQKSDKDRPNKRHFIPARPIMCEYAEGVLTFLIHESRVLYVSVEHTESGTSCQKTVSGSDPSIFIGTLPGTYEITATTQDNRIYTGVLTIN